MVKMFLFANNNHLGVAIPRVGHPRRGMSPLWLVRPHGGEC